MCIPLRREPYSRQIKTLYRLVSIVLKITLILKKPNFIKQIKWKILHIILFFFRIDCNGSVTLLSDKDESEIVIKSERLLRSIRRRGRKSVKKKIKRRGMRFAKVAGDCCWEIRDQFRGGEEKELWRPHTYHSPWSIRAVKLIKCWNT